MSGKKHRELLYDLKPGSVAGRGRRHAFGDTGPMPTPREGVAPTIEASRVWPPHAARRCPRRCGAQRSTARVAGPHRCASARRGGRRSAFSLLEVMVVLVIIGLAAGLITMNVRSQLMLAKRNAAKADVATIVSALDQFYLVYGRYPTNEEGLTILTEATRKIPSPLLKDTALTDPWNRSYEYIHPGLNHPYEVVSYGADGREGGEDASRDVLSWELKERNDEP